MTTFRFLHCADLHLDSPLRGLEAGSEAPVDKIRGASREALTNLVDYAVNERVDFVVAAGDLYDGDWQDWRTGHFLVSQIARLTNAGIPFIAIRGNHDAESVITRRLRMPGDIAHLLDHLRPQTIRLTNLPVSIHGQSFATRAVTENLARAYPRPDQDRFNIGLLHSSVGDRAGHDTYASCALDQLSAHGYDYWALGHIHKAEILSREPWIVFPGNIQGRHINEEGPKGAALVRVMDGKVVDVTPIAFDTVRWHRLTIDLPADSDEDTALTRIRAALAEHHENADGRLLAARITLSGACAAHTAFIRDLGAAREKIRAEALGVAESGMIWIERIEFATAPVEDIATRRDRGDAVGQLVRALEDVRGEDIRDGIQVYASTILDKANPLRGVIGSEHAATIAANGEISENLIERARNLLLGALDG